MSKTLRKADRRSSTSHSMLCLHPKCLLTVSSFKHGQEKKKQLQVGRFCSALYSFGGTALLSLVTQQVSVSAASLYSSSLFNIISNSTELYTTQQILSLGYAYMITAQYVATNVIIVLILS